jgi:hypothetical protein
VLCTWRHLFTSGVLEYSRHEMAVEKTDTHDLKPLQEVLARR